jgi:hypothetical protein
MTELEAQKTLADAILLERAAVVLERTSRTTALNGSWSALHWLDVKETLREVAQQLRLEAEEYAARAK